jgi:glycosyltransferase 2 family protein
LKHSLRIALSLGLSAIFLWIALHGVSWEEARASLREAHLWVLPPAFFIGILSLYFRALRWGILLRPFARVDTQPLMSATAIGFAANMLLPLRAGEVIRPWLLARKVKLPLAQTLATVALERLFDMATLLLFFAIATLTLPLPPEWKRYGWFFLATFVALLALLIALQQLPERTIALVSTLLVPLPDRISSLVEKAIRQFAEGLASLQSGAAIAIALAYSLVVWLTLALTFGLGISALELPVPWLRGALSLTAIVAIAVAIPGGPGFIGMFQVGCEVALGVYGITKSVAFSYSVLVHVIQFASSVLLGLYYFLRENVSLSELRNEASAAAGESTES